MPESVLFEICDAEVRIGPHRVCIGLDLKICAGQSWAILGPNGAGKTTLLHVLAGLNEPHSGTITFRDRPLGRWARGDLARELGILFQHPANGFAMRVLEVVLTGRHPHLGRWGWESEADLDIARSAIEELHLDKLEQRYLDSLSGGERRRVEIATLLAQQPRCALLDEPGSHLDIGQQINLMAKLRTVFTQHGNAMVTVLHDPTLAARFCEHAILISGDGRWQAGRTADLVTAEHLSSLYGYPLQQLPGSTGPVFAAR